MLSRVPCDIRSTIGALMWRRLMNHSCEPSLQQLQFMQLRGYFRVLFAATRHIYPGDELTIDYSALTNLMLSMLLSVFEASLLLTDMAGAASEFHPFRSCIRSQGLHRHDDWVPHGDSSRQPLHT